MAVDQILVDRRAVAPQPDLGLDELAMSLAPAGSHQCACRWPGWGSLQGGGGHGLHDACGHPVGTCLLGQPPLPIASERLAVDAAAMRATSRWVTPRARSARIVACLLGL